MSADIDEIRRQLGFGMPAPRCEMSFSVRTIQPQDSRKLADEQCNGVDADLLKGIVITFCGFEVIK
jgi:hypothetical protein